MEHYVFPEQSNAADWRWSYEAFADDGSPVDLSAITGLVLTLQLHPFRIPPGDTTPLIEGTNTDGTIAVSASTFEVVVRASRFADLLPGSYRVSVVMTDGTDTTQLVNGTLPLIEGYST